jgi:hypothetical protein
MKFKLILIVGIIFLFGCTALDIMNPNLIKLETKYNCTQIENLGNLGGDLPSMLEFTTKLDCINLVKSKLGSERVLSSYDCSNETLTCYFEKTEADIQKEQVEKASEAAYNATYSAPAGTPVNNEKFSVAKKACTVGVLFKQSDNLGEYYQQIIGTEKGLCAVESTYIRTEPKYNCHFKVRYQDGKMIEYMYYSDNGPNCNSDAFFERNNVKKALN